MLAGDLADGRECAITGPVGERPLPRLPSQISARGSGFQQRFGLVQRQ
jgi:hypothetical protein